MALRFEDLEGLFRACGFVLKRVRGSHRHYKHPSVPYILTLNPQGKAAHQYQKDRFLEVVEKYGLHTDL